MMKTWIIALLLLQVAWLCASQGAEESEDAPVAPLYHSMKAQKKAVKAWAKSLTDSDQSAEFWESSISDQPQDAFELYSEKLSELFREMGAFVNFALVGACDGTNDRTIRDKYLPNNHWRGVFVEPFSINFKDLHNFMDSKGVSNRTHIIQAAATRQCSTPTIKMKRPTFEEKNASLPHWMRRQIGSIVPNDKLDRPMTGGWIAEFVRCVTGNDILRDWAAEVTRQMTPGGKAERSGSIRKMRPHVLKIDVEGHDYNVLMGFIDNDTPNSELPLLINFEAKSVGPKLPELKEHMEARGYVVSRFANDAFAMLRADKIFDAEKKRRRKGKKSKKGMM